MFNFLNAELQAARTFLALAKGASNGDSGAVYFRHACEAYETVQHFVGRVPLTLRQQDHVQQRLTDLKWNLDPERPLDESVDDSSSVPDSLLDRESSQLVRNVAKFLELSERLRVEASKMLQLNQHLIQQNKEIFRRLSHPAHASPPRLPALVL